jgi:GAF domain-containing protein
MELGDRVGSARTRLRSLAERLGAAPALLEAGVEGDLAAIARDLDDLRAALDELEPTQELLRLIVTAPDCDTMVHNAARFLQERTAVDAVGIRLREGQDYPYFVTCGFPEEFVTAESHLVAGERDGRARLHCLCGRVISGAGSACGPPFTAKGSFWTNCTSELLTGCSAAALLGPTRDRCHAAGYESVALVPLRLGSETLGLLQLNDRRRDRFSPDRIALVETWADYLAAALG